MLENVSLDDKYSKDSGRIFVTGIQALVRLPMLQSGLDRAAGLNTAAYISGYRGSPLGALDLQLWQAKPFLERHNIVFQPGINEDLAATAIWGTQQAELDGAGLHDGVFCIWYGKGPGVDRSGDALRHANLAGTSRHGGVLVAMGDDHACESSTTAHQSEYALVDAMIPILNPSGVQDIVDFGLYGWALSRYSGCWVGLKCVHDTVEASASIVLDRDRAGFVTPEDIVLPSGGLNIRWPDTPLQQEQRLHEHKLPAVQAFWRANSLDRIVMDSAHAKVGIVTSGKSYSDVRRALKELHIGEDEAARLGIRLYKIALSWPLEQQGLSRFAEGLSKIIVVEEKRGLIEDQIKTVLYGRANAPEVVGKSDVEGRSLLPSTARLNAMQIAEVIGRQALTHIPSEELRQSTELVSSRIGREVDLAPIQRVPYFCAGCPHNTSTKVPEGSIALAGIGCHYMAQWMDRSTARFTQMGGEGASWIGESRFSKRKHVFQNIGDGTYLHSGLLAIRAAVASKTTMTFKLLYNDAVAMTGGQPFDGPLTVTQIANQLLAEGVNHVAVVTDDVESCRSRNRLPDGVSVSDRSELDQIQRQCRDVPAVSAIIYDQTCAAEKRRRRKRGEYPDPPKRVFINTEVCEGCGDCGVQSNCVAIVPHETVFGRKRRIDQSACNKDYSCVEGFCPSFVTVHGGQPRKPAVNIGSQSFDPSNLPEPVASEIDGEYCIVVTGVGGTGVITIGAILGMAAHLAELGCSVLDMTGLAQKGGSVISNLVIANHPDEISSTHVASGGANLILGGDLVVAASEKVLSTADYGSTTAVINDYEMMPGEFARISDLKFPGSTLKENIEKVVASANTVIFNANRFADQLFGDTIAANMMMVGVAIQKGWIPIPLQAVERAIELNGRSVEMNKLALHRGRQLAASQDDLKREITASGNDATPAQPEELSLEDITRHRSESLVRYQDEAYAKRYADLVNAADEAEKLRTPGMNGFAMAVGRYYYKLLAYKDEYEVARLFTDGRFRKQLEAGFEGDYKIEFHMAPPVLARKSGITGVPAKLSFGSWLEGFLAFLARMRFLRGTPFDPFGRSADRRMERQLISDYEELVQELIQSIDVENHRIAVELASFPESVRGFGHIKKRHVEASQSRIEELLAAFRSDETKPEAA
ncbi:MAG: indolepyruvate ferredoxin oxidoreductase family protein [Acidiferrobacterales bacterium]|nr:indolepyruvate ferredoxin oxidoreductase family protein [Acidiferrobacterales bacterium]